MPNSNRFVLAAGLVFLAAAAGAAVLEDVVARVNGKPLLLSEYRKNLRSVMENYQRSMPELLRDADIVREMRKKVLDQMVDDELLAQKAEAVGVKVHGREVEKGISEVQSRSFAVDENGRRRTEGQQETALKSELKKEGLTWDQFRDRIKRQLMIRKVVESEVQSKLQEPTRKETEAAYDKLRFIVKGDTDVIQGLEPELGQAYLAFGERLRAETSERVRVSHILVKVSDPGLVVKNQALKKAKEIKSRLDKGEDFYEVAKKESDDLESAPRGGDLRWILRGFMPPAFEKEAFSLPVGEVSEPVETDFGYHLIRVQEKKASESLSFDKIELPVKEFVFNLNAQTKLLDFVEGLRQKATLDLRLPAD